MNVKELTKGYETYGISMRRTFHMNPEASMKEFETQKQVMDELKRMGISSEKIGGTGVVAYIEGEAECKVNDKSDYRTIALRADMDALELCEESDHEYISRNAGLMHACGHDGHMASLLLAAKVLTNMKDQFVGRVKLIFQPGEETARGAKILISEGVMEDVDGIFGIHLWNDCAIGKVSAEAGPRMASAGIFKIQVEGKGGHGSMPHQGVDAGVVGAAIVMNLQSIVSREIDPLDSAVVSVGIFNSGTRFNVMPGEAYLEGTTRCFSLEVNNRFEDRIRRIAESTATSYRATARLDYEELVIPTINEASMSRIVLGAVEKNQGPEAIVTYEKTTGGEDFSYYGQHAPSAFAFVGCRKEEVKEYYPHHHPKFDIDERAIAISAMLYAQVAIDFLDSDCHV